MLCVAGSAGSVVCWHHAQLRPFAVVEVVQWANERKALKIPGPLLFPATLQGGCLNKAPVYRQTKATFARAGIAVPRLVGKFLGRRLCKATKIYAPKKSNAVP